MPCASSHLNEWEKKSQRQGKHPDLKQVAMLAKLWPCIDETSECTAPQKLAKQNKITFMWVTFQTLLQLETKQCHLLSSRVFSSVSKNGMKEIYELVLN